MADPKRLYRWIDRARESVIHQGHRICAECGAPTETRSYNRESWVICPRCGTVACRAVEVQPTFFEVVG